MKILVTPTSMQSNEKFLQILRDASLELVFNPKGKPLDENELLELLPECDGYIAGLDNVSAEVLSRCPKLKVISRYGAGCDRVDLKAAKQYGITVTNTPGVNAQAVGELALGLMFSVARRIPYLDRTTKDGEWVRSTGIELKGKTLGILGLGAIGRVVANSASACGMFVQAYDPFINKDYCSDHKISPVSMDLLISTSDVISIHLPLSDDTKHLISDEQIERMKDGVILINTSRGGIVDEAAALAALKSGKMGGLALDAFEHEPPGASPLFGLPNVIATPHTGAHTHESTENMAALSVDNLLRILQGRPCQYIVN